MPAHQHAVPCNRCLRFAGVMFNKDVVAPGRMRRKIVNPRILLLDCPLEYKKGENQTNVEITKVGGRQCIRVTLGEGQGFARPAWNGTGLESLCEITLCTSWLGGSNDIICAQYPPAAATSSRFDNTRPSCLQEEDWAALLKAEEEAVKRMCDQIIAFKPDVVVTEKGLSDLATHFFTKSVMGQGQGAGGCIGRRGLVFQVGS